MPESLIKRRTHYPPTYFVLKEKSKFYLLFWLEHGRDGSLYIWFDDYNNSWEVIALHKQNFFYGESKISLIHKPLEIYDPHISWHQSGAIHVTGYSQKDRIKKKVISDRPTDSIDNMVLGLTIPVTQMVLPTVNSGTTLKLFSKDLSEFKNPRNWIATIDNSGIEIKNNNASGAGIFLIDSAVIPEGHNLGVDLWISLKGRAPNLYGKDMDSLLTQHVININRGRSITTACVRLFSLPFLDKPETLKYILATCFNKKSVDLFQLKRVKDNT